MSRGDQAERGADARALEVGVDAEAGEARDRVGEVELAVGLEQLLLLGREDAVDQVARLLRRELRVSSGMRLELAAHADDRRRADGEVEVGGVGFDHLGEQVVDGASRGFGHVRPVFGGWAGRLEAPAMEAAPRSPIGPSPSFRSLERVTATAVCRRARRRRPKRRGVRQLPHPSSSLLLERLLLYGQVPVTMSPSSGCTRQRCEW